MLLIPYENIKNTVPKGLKDHLGVEVIRRNQTSPAPSYPYLTWGVLTLASANNGTWQEHDDGKDRKAVLHSWSISALSDDCDESVALAMRAREWLEHTGRLWLKDHGITVQSVTQVTPRDNVLSVGYEYKNGFDVFFYVFDEVERPNADDYIESASVTQK